MIKRNNLRRANNFKQTKTSRMNLYLQFEHLVVLILLCVCVKRSNEGFIGFQAKIMEGENSQRQLSAFSSELWAMRTDVFRLFKQSMIDRRRRQFYAATKNASSQTLGKSETRLYRQIDLCSIGYYERLVRCETIALIANLLSMLKRCGD